MPFNYIRLCDFLVFQVCFLALGALTGCGSHPLSVAPFNATGAGAQGGAAPTSASGGPIATSLPGPLVPAATPTPTPLPPTPTPLVILPIPLVQPLPTGITPEWDFGVAPFPQNCSSAFPPGVGWQVAVETSLNSDPTYGPFANACLFVRSRGDGFKAVYTITHAGGSATNPVSCASEAVPPDDNFALKSQSCLLPIVGGGCASDICLWEEPATTPSILVITNAGGTQDDIIGVDCRNLASGVPGFFPNRVDRVPLLSNGAGIVFNDLCLLSEYTQ